SGRVELRRGDVRRPEELAAHLEAIGFERVSMVEDVAQFSVRGGIFDVYGFGMAEPVRLEFWGDEVAELRHFDLLTQRSTRDAELALILPVDGVTATGAPTAEGERVSLLELWAPDTVVVVPRYTHLEPELRRTRDEAHQHLELARRRGEDVAPRHELFEAPEAVTAGLARLGTIALAGPADPGVEIVFPIRGPEAIDRDIRRLRRIASDGTPTVVLCDNAGQCERLEELLTEGGGPLGAALTVGVLDGGFVIPPQGHEPGLRV